MRRMLRWRYAPPQHEDGGCGSFDKADVATAAATLILRCGGAAGASKGESCGLCAVSCEGCFEGAARHLSIRASLSKEPLA
ncbi:hypothetical protein CTT39_16535 [Agrobacterium rosae]|nr:hypothetical protein CTT39_16535 [Agrobacterium rosae]